MTPWDFEARVYEMKLVLKDLEAMREREHRTYMRALWTTRAMSLFCIAAGLWNVATVLARVCHH
jgi:hypothetical protein